MTATPKTTRRFNDSDTHSPLAISCSDKKTTKYTSEWEHNPAKEVNQALHDALITKRCEQLFEMIGAQNGELHGGNMDISEISPQYLGLFSQLDEYVKSDPSIRVDLSHFQAYVQQITQGLTGHQKRSIFLTDKQLKTKLKQQALRRGEDMVQMRRGEDMVQMRRGGDMA